MVAQLTVEVYMERGFDSARATAFLNLEDGRDSQVVAGYALGTKDGIYRSASGTAATGSVDDVLVFVHWYVAAYLHIGYVVKAQAVRPSMVLW
jgi:hypothetical protein